MKKYLLLFVTGLCFSAVEAQLVRQEAQTPKKQSDLDWYNCSFDQDGVYGAEVKKTCCSFDRYGLGRGTRGFETSRLG